MSINLEIPEVAPREERLNSILSYHGSASELREKSVNGKFRVKDRFFSQCGSCASSCAFVLNSIIIDTAVVLHAPVGCGSDFSGFNSLKHQGARHRGLKADNLCAVISNLEEKDTIYGGEKKLRQAIIEANERFHPKAIFVNTSCASGIIGEDIESIIEDMETEINIPIVPVYCEGFRSKIWSSGFDATAHGIVRKLVKPPHIKSKTIVNVFNFRDSHSFDSILGKLGLEPRYIFPFATVEELGKLSEAVASAHICETLGNYVATALEEKYGVPEVKAPAPYGIEWTDQWLRELGIITKQTELVEKLILTEHERIEVEIVKLRKILTGVKVYILAGDSFVHNMASITNSLGIKIIGSTAFHHDQIYDGNYPQVNSLSNMLRVVGDVEHYTVCNRQPYEFYKMIEELKPDLLIARHGNITATGSKLGIPSFFVTDANLGVGYDGVVAFGKKIVEILKTKKYIDTISKHARLPYTDWWKSQEPFYFEKNNTNTFSK